ncbi:MAG: FAD-binding oxidoreductase [Aestuariivirga sp.]
MALLSAAAGATATGPLFAGVMMPSAHDKTWYEATADRGPVRPALSGTEEAEACVIGGGLAGLTAALELARRGKKVILLESQRVAWAASGRNGGFVSNGFAEGLDEITKKVGLEAARHLYRLSCFGTEFVRREIAETDPTIKMGEGWIGARRFNDADGLKAYRDHLARDFGEERQFWTTEETRAKLASTRYYQSLVDATAFHMHPLRYALMIAAKAEKSGAVLHEEAPAVSVAGGKGRWEVRTAKGAVRTPHVIYTVSSLDRALHPVTARAVLPVATYVAVTEPLQQELDPYTERRVGPAAGRKLLSACGRRPHPVGRGHHHARVGAFAPRRTHEARHALGLSPARKPPHRLCLGGPHGLCAALHAADRRRRAGAMVGHGLRRPWHEHNRHGRPSSGARHCGGR